MEFFERKDTAIMCPNCGKFLTKADKRNDNIQKVACLHCYKWIWFKACNDYREVLEIPERNTSSGMRFY